MARITIDLSKGVFEVEGSEEFVEKHFTEFQPQLSIPLKSGTALTPGITVPPIKQTQKKAVAKRSKKIEVPDALKTIDLPSKLTDGIAYVKLKSPQDKLLWTLALAKELRMDGLVGSDIVWITDTLGSGIANNHVSVHYQRLRDKEFANQSTLTGKMRITDEGLQYLSALPSKQKPTHQNG